MQVNFVNWKKNILNKIWARNSPITKEIYGAAAER